MSYHEWDCRQELPDSLASRHIIENGEKNLNEQLSSSFIKFLLLISGFLTSF